MILIDWDRTARFAPGMVLVFGTGLIGGAAVRAIVSRIGTARQRHFDWNWAELAASEATALEAATEALLAARPDARLTVIWAAGRSGFGSDDAAMDHELRAFRRVLATVRRTGGSVPEERRAFIHVSSAGGLFEGQTACGPTAEPSPLRPYGTGKLAQEALVLEDAGLGRRHILRPSSVYGYAPGARRGLIAALIAAAVRGRPATIMGSLTTQRDYVYAIDIGRFIATRTFDETPPGASTEIALLASARPTSIFEVIQLIEGHQGAKLLLRIDPRPENARDNTFLPNSLPSDFTPTRLSEGIALTAAAMTHDRFMGAML
ncbi:MAG: NAD-dependent epimerase/dehydratase family protein [Pseudomonadota bacterium]